MDDVARVVGSALASTIVRTALVPGGDTATSSRFDLADGRVVFVKTHRSPPAGCFSREAADLAWLREADVLAVPRVLAVSDDAPAFLALEWIEPGHLGRYDDEAGFGRNLARLHQAGAPSFGREDCRTTGSLALPNDPVGTWAAFYAERRLLPLARLARDRRSLSDATILRIERLASRLEDLGGPPEPPARVHGDLWAGNRLVDTAGVSWLIDPAAHGGHREFDLAMMRLFGGFGDEAFRAYDDTFALADGWQRRVPLHQLAPFIVHAIKFGGSYAAAVSAALTSVE